MKNSLTFIRASLFRPLLLRSIPLLLSLALILPQSCQKPDPTPTPTPTPTPVTPTEVAVTGISLDKSSGSIDVGETVELTATVAPSNATDKTVSWSSSDNSVASIAPSGIKCKVTGVKEGSATITAKAGGKTATCNITVKKAFIEVTSVVLDRTADEMIVGTVTELFATVYPDNATDKTVTWSSSDNSMTTLNENGNGRCIVTAEKVGTVTVTATAGSKSASCVLTIKEPSIPVTQYYLNQGAYNVALGKSVTAKVIFSPENATDANFTWSVVDPDIASISVSGYTCTITGKAIGTTQLHLQKEGAAAYIRADIHVTVSGGNEDFGYEDLK